MTTRTGPRPEVRDQVWTRDGGRCLRCGASGDQIHHRKPRQMGGTRDESINRLSNLVLLCRECHERIESHRTVAYATGWLVHRHANPAEVSLSTMVRTIILDDQGGVTLKGTH